MENTASFFNFWDRVVRLGAYGFIGIGIGIFLYYELQVSRIKDNKDKYDYVNLHEIKYFWYSLIALIIAIALFINSIGTAAMTSETMLWFYVRLFITTSFVIISYFIFFGMVRIYYPKSVEKRLRKLRAKPRVSPAGNVMRKLSEDEEDAHLEASQIAEEAVHSIDYDVWIDDKTGYKKVEKYFSYQHAEECPECGYYTFKIIREDVEKAPTESEHGLVVKHLACNYCEHREAREVTIARLSDNVKG